MTIIIQDIIISYSGAVLLWNQWMKRDCVKSEKKVAKKSAEQSYHHGKVDHTMTQHPLKQEATAT